MRVATAVSIMTFVGIAVAIPVAAAELQQEVRATEVIDLTHVMHEDMAFWPGGVPFEMTRLVDYDKGYRLHKFEVGENTGTHVDAPSHFAKGGRNMHELALQELVVPAIVINVQSQVETNPDFLLSAEDVEAWEREHGRIPSGSLVILNTGWYKRFDTPEKYVNMDDAKVMHFPGYGPDSAELLLKRGVAGIGIDTLSLDNGPSKAFKTHHIMLPAGKYMIENLNNLDQLPATGATVVIGVLPVRGGTQAQARIFAFK